MGTRTGAGTETKTVAEMGNGYEGGREAKARKKPHKSCRRHVGKGGDLGGKRKKTYSRQGLMK